MTEAAENVGGTYLQKARTSRWTLVVGLSMILLLLLTSLGLWLGGSQALVSETDSVAHLDSTFCETPTLPTGAFHIVIAGYAAKTCFKHYIWGLGLSNAEVFVYRREDLHVPARTWHGPCGVVVTEVILAPNQGRDAAAFYDYALRVYRSPPKAVLFLHGHGPNGYHTSCQSVFSRSHMFYQSLAGTNYTGFSDHMVTLTSREDRGKDVTDWLGGRRLLQEADPKQVCEKVLEDWNVSVSRELSWSGDFFASCCANFIMPGERLLLHPEGLYFSLRAVTLNQTLDDEQTGRECFEFLIWPLFREPPLTEQMLAYYDLSQAVADGMGNRLKVCENNGEC